MKKIFYLYRLCLILIAFCLIFTGCEIHKEIESESSSETQTNDEFQTELEGDDEIMNQNNDDYAISILSDVESGIFKDSYILKEETYPTTETLLNPILSTLHLGNMELSAYKTKIVHISSTETIDVFLSADNNIEYRVNSSGHSFSISAKNNSVLYSCNSDITSETSMVEMIKEYISSFVDISDIGSYTMSCSTSVVVMLPDAAWREEKEGCYVVPSELSSTEKVLDYQYVFAKYCNGYKTSDIISVKCSPTGDILYVSYSNFGVDWKKFNVNEKKINSMVGAYLANAIVPPCTIKEYKRDGAYLVYRDNQIKLALTYELTLMKNNSEFVVLCQILVSTK